MIPARMATELVSATLKAGMALRSAVSTFSCDQSFRADTPVISFADMSSFEHQLARPPPRRSRAGSSRPPVPFLAPIPATSLALRSQ